MLSEPNAGMLAEKLQACLDRVQEARRQETVSEAVVTVPEPTHISG
jgi:hypothetical protein